MGEIPAEWLERSAAIAAKKAGNGNIPVSTPKIPEINGPTILGDWIKFEDRKEIKAGETYLAIMKSTGVRGIVIRGITMHPDYRWRYHNKVTVDTEDIKWLCRADFNLPKGEL